MGAKRRKQWKVGKPEITFVVGVGILLAMTFAAVAFRRPADPTLVAAALGMAGIPVYLQSDKKRDDDDTDPG